MTRKIFNAAAMAGIILAGRFALLVEIQMAKNWWQTERASIVEACRK